MKQTKTRIYKVTTPLGSQLIRAQTPAAAIRHAVRDLFDAEVASQDDIVKLVAAGEKVIDAGVDTSIDDKAVDAFPAEGEQA